MSDDARGAAGAAPRIAWYAFTVFASSALVLEVVAGRLIAPYVGMSLYTWTAIIGVILAGLSLGNQITAAELDPAVPRVAEAGLFVDPASGPALAIHQGEPDGCPPTTTPRWSA